MKALVLVLFDRPGGTLLERLKEVLEPHRLDEDDPDSIRRHHWDYWFLPDDEAWEDVELRRDFPDEEAEVLANAAYGRNLREDFTASALVLEDGRWLDLQDEGWRMMREPSKANTTALAAWSVKFRKMLAEHADRICVRVVVHC